MQKMQNAKNANKILDTGFLDTPETDNLFNKYRVSQIKRFFPNAAGPEYLLNCFQKASILGQKWH